MTLHLGDVPASSTLYIPFVTYDANGASVTMTGLAVTDIEIYKNGSVTQRASDNGYALLDTDGIDFDGITGLHGFSVDLSDNSDSGFFSVGGFYWVVVSTITVATQTVTHLAATFRIVAAESSAGVPKVDVSHFNGTAGTFASGRPEVNTSHIAGSAVSASSAQIGVNLVNIAGAAVNTSSAQLGVNVVNAGGTAWGSGAITAAAIASNAITSAKIAADAIGASQIADGAIDAATIVDGSITAAKIGAGAITASKFAAGAIDAAAIATDAIDSDAVAASAVSEIQSGLSTLTASQVLTTALSDAYAANGNAPTLQQALMAIHQYLMEKDISGTSLAVKKLDGTTAFTVTLNSATAPTASSRD